MRQDDRMEGRGIRARRALAGLGTTVHGGQAWRSEGVEDYSHNLNPFGPPDDIGEIMASAADDVWHYPDDSCASLKSTISRVFGVGEDNIMVGAGSSELIRNFPNAFLEPGDKALLHRPSFAEYEQQCRIAGAEIVWNDLLEEDGFRIDPEKVTALIEGGARAVYICNPNNPTGRIEPRDKLVRIIGECSDSGIPVFVDETLLELVPGYGGLTCSGLVDRYDNLVVAGSLTKSFAIPGIRIGFGFASASLVEEMDKVRMTWNIGQMEQTVAEVLIGERMDHVHRAAEMMAAESKVMNRRLNGIGFPAGEVSDSFFYFNKLGSLGILGSEFKRMMLERGIMVRDCASFGERMQGFVRYSVKDRERNDRFVDAVEDTLKGLRA